MGKWLELAARLEAKLAGDNRDDRDDSPQFRPNVAIVPNVPRSLPSSVCDGLLRLKSMPAPRLVDCEPWPRIVRDALWLGESGWAAKALALGWCSLDLFGAVPDVAGDPENEGLAMWLAGRNVSLVNERLAAVKHGSGTAYYHRRDQEGAVLLWDIGRERP